MFDFPLSLLYLSVPYISPLFFCPSVYFIRHRSFWVERAIH